MFSLLSPLFLWAASAATVPLVLHMIQSSRTVRMPFSTIRFLKLAEKRSSRRIKMEHFILWILRTVLMLLLALAFAMPMIRSRGFGNLLGRAERDVAIIIDNSYSMGYKPGRETVWQKTIETVTAIIESLNEKDRFCIYLAEREVNPLIEQLTTDQPEAISRIKGLEMAKATSYLAPAVIEAYAVLAEETRRREREVHIISDTQALPWDSFGRNDAEAPVKKSKKEKKKEKDKKEKDKKDGEDSQPAEKRSSLDSAWDPSKVDDRTTFFVTLLGSSSPENVCPVDVDLSPRLIIGNSPSRVTVQLAHSGPSRGTAITLFVDDKEIGKRSAVVGGEASGEIAFAVPPLKHGTHTARVETPEDNLPVDNEFHFLMRVKDKLPTLCVGSDDDTFFLRTALETSLGTDSEVELKAVKPDQLNTIKLAQYACVFLCNVLPLSGQERLTIEDYVKAGGVAIIFPGDSGMASDYQAWEALPAEATSFLSLPMRERKKMLRWEMPHHAMLRNLRMGGGAAVITVRKHLVYPIELPEDTDFLISVGGETPFCIGHDLGRGHVLMFSIAADRSWSDFPLSPFYLPVIHQVVQFAAGVGGFTHFLWATDSLPLQEYIPEATRDSKMKDPEGQDVPIRGSVDVGRTLLRVENLITPGVYTISTPEQPDSTPGLAINMERKESTLTPIDPGNLAAILGVEKLNIAHDKEDLLKQIEDHRIGKTFGEQLLWIALILAAAEFFYANMLLKQTPKLTDQLGIEASGKVTGGLDEGEAPVSETAAILSGEE